MRAGAQNPTRIACRPVATHYMAVAPRFPLLGWFAIRRAGDRSLGFLAIARGVFLITRWWFVLTVLCLPWLAVQAYYARPFVEVASGVMSRDSFLRDYVAFTGDFNSLDKPLPREAVIYAVNSRLPAYYSPRPVILTLEDLRNRGPLYRFSEGQDADLEQTSLLCTEKVYENGHATAVAFRTPGRQPFYDKLIVKRCAVVSSK